MSTQLKKLQAMTKRSWGVLISFGKRPPELAWNPQLNHPFIAPTKKEATAKARSLALLGFEARVVKMQVTYTYFQP